MAALGYEEREVRDGFASYASARGTMMLPIVVDISGPVGESEFQARLENQGGRDRAAACRARSTVALTPCVARPLRYPRIWPDAPSYEKGVDVELAVDIVSLALRDTCDVTVVASADTDLLPAIEEVRRRTSVVVEVAAWSGMQSRRRLAVPGRNVWCHWLRGEDYERARDDTDYNLGSA